MEARLNNVTAVERPKNAQPWTNMSPRVRISSILTIVIPAAVFALTLLFTGMDFMAGLFTVFLPLQLLMGGWAGFYSFGKRGITDGLLLVVTFFLSLFVFVLLASVLWSVIQSGFAALSPHFIYQNNVYVSGKTGLEIGGVGHAILGTIITVGISMMVTVPLGIATAVYLTETRDFGRGIVRTLLQAMSALPSVVSGLFIYSMLILSGWSGYSGLMGSLALIPLMLPTVARVAEESLRLVPKDLRNGALALGAPSYRAFFMVTLPAAQSGIVTAVLLGIARVIGETAPILLTMTLANGTNLNPLEGGMATLPGYIFNYILLGDPTSIARAWGAALVLLIFVGILFAAARIASSPKKAKKRSAK
jgi:phosphate transport system permease protein